MILDAHSVPSGSVIETDICIVGGGAAGITLAREFIGSGLRVTLLESGGHKPDPATQDLYTGADVGRPYEIFPISRFRYFGGTTNHWGGAWCDLPSPLDFEAREGVPHSGWPFSLSDLEPWYRRAQPIFRLGPFGYALPDWGIAPADVHEPFRGPHFVCRVLQQAPLTRFALVYGPELRRADNITVYLHANALRFEVGENDKSVQEVEVGVLPSGRFKVRARIYIIASGGIESARLLLLSENQKGVGIGNDHDLVGRFFMLHLEYADAAIALKNPSLDLSFQTGENGAKYKRFGVIRRFVSYISLSDETKRVRNLPALRFRFRYPRLPAVDALRRIIFRREAKGNPFKDLQEVIRAFPSLIKYVTRRVIYGRNKPPSPLALVPLKITSEQMPNPESRIRLGDDLDVFGLRKVVIDWQLTEEDRRGLATGLTLLREELVRGGFGELHAPVFTEDGWPRGMRGDQHHMGTTRMHRDPRQGVVNENCRVHGVENLYIASCSVFPTGGTFNPTLTIVALALRLADHIKQLPWNVQR